MFQEDGQVETRREQVYERGVWHCWYGPLQRMGPLPAHIVDMVRSSVKLAPSARYRLGVLSMMPYFLSFQLNE